MVIEHQLLIAAQLLSYQTEIEDEAVPQMLKSIGENISVLDFRICGNLIVALHGDTKEFLVPIDGEFEENQHYLFKPELKIVNAVRLRHYGSFCRIRDGLSKLEEYVCEKSLAAITDPYVVCKNTSDSNYDIYIGISENVL